MEAVARITDSQTEVETVAPVSPPVLRLRLQKPKTDRKVGWRAGTVDNEHMNKKKSKCCCIYRKPTVFGESSSEDDEDCEHCFGHPEKRKKNIKKRHDHGHDHHDHDHHDHDHGDDSESGDDGPTCSFKPKGNAQPVDTEEVAPTPPAQPTPNNN